VAKQRMVSTKFWSDPWVVDELNPLDRYLFLYLLTNEKTNIAGVYELSVRTMANETGIEKEELLRMLKRLESRVLFVMGWVVFRKSIKHQNFRSPKIESAIARELQDVPEDVIKYIDFPVNLGELLHERYGIDTVSHLTNTKLIPNLTNTKPNGNAPDKPGALEKVPTKEIDGLMELWAEIVGYEVKGMANRKACAALVREYGTDKLKQLMLGVAKSHDDQYAPRISDFVSLKRKVNDLILWGRKQTTPRVSKGRGFKVS
jgi:hypothetical protein